jgi:phosphoglycerate dehydrogenase-like enzyme
VNVWIPDRAGHDAVGELPESIALGLVPQCGELPLEIMNAEFLVPGAGDRRVRELIPGMRELRVIQTLSAGVDWLLPSVPTAVTVCDGAGTRDTAVAEWVLAALLASQRRLPEMRDRQREHAWDWHQSVELAGSTVMILGYGSIGAAVEARLRPFDVELIRVARRERTGVHPADELRSLLPLADAVVVLLPLTGYTAGLLESDLLACMRPGALLVNAARGQIVDTDALVKLLHAERIRAVLDVTDPEPLPAAHPLWDAPGVLITPHFAGDTMAADRRAFALVGDQVRRYVRHDPLINIVKNGY